MPPERPQNILKSELANDPEIADLVQEFVGELPQKVDAILKALGDGDAIRLRTLAHQLKGAAGGYGFPTIGVVAKRVEDCLRVDGSATELLERARSGVDELILLCQQASRSQE
jgi:HPt (histidine-containing phosphotransfer) domain-containing protein